MTQTRTRVADPAIAVEGYREGSRWIHEKPPGEELAAWFAENVKLHKGLEHADYITGIVLIPQKEKYKHTSENGTILDDERLTFTPYPTTGARLAYFRDWIEVQNEKRKRQRGEPLLWAIEPDPSIARDQAMPAGFFRYVVETVSEAGTVLVRKFVGCSMQVRVYERDIRSGEKGRPVLLPPAGSKVVPTVAWGRADENALMKAQTGAIGRALAYAGMLVIPGTGVATAEDVQEAVSGGAAAAPVADVQATLPLGAPEGPSEPTAAPGPVEETDQRGHAAELIGQLQAYPEKLAEVQAWAQERKVNLSNISDRQLRGAVRLLERKLEEAQAEEPADPQAGGAVGT